MSRLLLFRHGKASDSWSTYDQLSERGFRQAAHAGKRLLAEEVTLAGAYHGKMRRQRETGEAVKRVFEEAGRPFPTLVELPSLDEIAPGVVDTALLEEKDPGVRERVTAWITGTAKSTHETRLFLMSAFSRYCRGELVGDFEPWDEFRARVASALTAMTDPDRGTTAAFTSGGFIATAAGLALDAPIDRTIHLMATLENASVTELRYSRSRARFSLVRLNDIGHLPPAERTLL